MSKRALILVEGHTEERFVKDVLAPAFWEQELYLTPTLLVTKRVKDGQKFKGGVTNFAKFENDVYQLLRGAGGALVTTLVDYYGLPSDFPGMATRPNGSPRQRVNHVEAAIRQHFGDVPEFIPFLALHEFEAWLFSSTDVLPIVMTQKEKQAEFSAIRAGYVSPEDINERPEWAPSKLISSIFPGYRKKLHGPTTAGRIGLGRIRAECPHFASWLSALEAYAGA
jgi:hypothetical protein